MTAAEACAGLILIALVAYALTGGADFGGGTWDLLARGPRRAAQRAAIERALAPVWEANHVWLIFAIVVLFTAFPAAYAAVSTTLHIPLTLLLLGIVARGSAFVFRSYGGESARAWGRVFAVASVVTPVMLGVLVGAITDGHLPLVVPAGARFSAVYVTPWLAPFPLAVGVFALALFSYLAAVYLAWEAERQEGGDRALADDFRRRALVAGVALAPIAAATAVLALSAPAFLARWTRAPWIWPLHACAGAAAVVGLVALWRRRYGHARVAAVAQVTVILLGWAAGQYPVLVAPDLTIESARAPLPALRLLLVVVVAGMVLLVPSLVWLLRVFKRGPIAPVGH